MADIANLTKIPELRKRILFTLAMLGVYRIGIFIHTPWINTAALQNFLQGGTILEIFKIFSGGALKQFSVFALGIMPYISASIIFQLLTVAVPAVEKLSKEGDAGRRKITQYSRYLTVVLSMIQGFGISFGLRSRGFADPSVDPIIFFLCTVSTLSAGTCFLMWLGEIITERGIGNGISLIIFAGIISSVPGGLKNAWENKEQYGNLFGFLLLMAAIGLVIAVVIFLERSQRRLPVQYAKRVVGRQLMSVQGTHLPLKVNSAGVIPPIFASAVIMFPATIAQFNPNNQFLSSLAHLLTSGGIYVALYGGLIIFFTYFYTAVAFNPVDVSENLKKQGGYIPGIRPGKSTSDHLDYVLSRIALCGALYMVAVCIAPTLIGDQFGVPRTLVQVFDGTSLLIMVGVAMDTLAQMESHLLSHHYEGFLGGQTGRFRGRK